MAETGYNQPYKRDELQDWLRFIRAKVTSSATARRCCFNSLLASPTRPRRLGRLRSDLTADLKRAPGFAGPTSPASAVARIDYGIEDA
jgi:hypothetical protein